MDAEPGQSHGTGASSTGPADEHLPADPAAPEAANGSGGVGKDRAARDSADKGADGDGAVKDAAGEDGDGKDSAGKGASGKAAGDKRKRSFWRELFVIIVAALVLTILIKAFLVQVFSIPSASMQNTLQPGDRILVNRLVYHLRDIARGDVVVFSGEGSWDPPAPPPPGNPVARLWDDITGLVGVSVPGTDYVKRVIGLPGDHVVCCDTQGRVTVNGVPLTEQSYTYPGDAPSLLKFNITVPAGRLFVLGDHRSDSADSRYHPDAPGNGTIPEDEVVGRAFVIIWPPSRIGDIPIPETFKQAGLNSAAAAVNLAPAVTGGTAAAGVLAWRRRRSRNRRVSPGALSVHDSGELLCGDLPAGRPSGAPTGSAPASTLRSIIQERALPSNHDDRRWTRLPPRTRHRERRGQQGAKGDAYGRCWLTR
jgi:signal peptidase I